MNACRQPRAALLRRRVTAMAVALLLGGAPFPAPGADAPTRQALERGRDAVAACKTLIEHDALELLPCIDYHAGQAQDRSRMDALQRLGAYFSGWVMADSAAAFDVEGAAAASRALAARLAVLQKRLAVSDKTLCALVDVPCAQMRNRRLELSRRR